MTRWAAAGDQLLTDVTGRLLGHLRDGDTLTRFGGDEFVVLCPEVDSTEAVLAIARRLSEALDEPITLRGRSLRTSASIGIVLADSSTTSAEARRPATGLAASSTPPLPAS